MGILIFVKCDLTQPDIFQNCSNSNLTGLNRTTVIWLLYWILFKKLADIFSEKVKPVCTKN